MFAALSSLFRRLPSLALAMLFLCVSFAFPAQAQPDVSREAKLLAAIVVKLPRYIDWPEEAFTDADSPLRVCLIGRSSVFEALEDMNGRSVGGRMLEVVSGSGQAVQGVCHLAYVARSEESELQRVLADLNRGYLVTVSDISTFAERGGVIELARKERRFGFRINLASARSSGVTISAQLLQLAEVLGLRVSGGSAP
ncbi:MAG: YfiR family protein [Pseudomonadota bacterium]